MRGRRPVLPLAVGFAAGIALAPSFPFPLGAAFAAPILAFSPPLAPLGLLCAGLAAGGLSAAPTVEAQPPRTEVTLEGPVVSVPERLDERARFLLRDAEGRLLEVTAPAADLPLAWGDRVRLSARLRSPSPPANPGGRDRAARDRARGIALEAFARDPPVRVAAPSALAALEAARTRFAALATAALPPREAALVRALGTGEQSALDPATMDAFARSGLVHILSLGGLHLAVVAFGTFSLLRRLLDRVEPLARRLEPRRAAAALALPLTLAYAFVTGAQVPMVRSSIGAACAFLGTLLDREGEALNTVCLAGLAILAAEPGALLDPSFQLSFASVAGLALLAGPLRRAIPFAPGAGRVARLAEPILRGACASAAATVATAPLVAFHFRRLSLAAVPANVAGVPVGAALTVLSALAGVASVASPALAAPLLWLCRPAAWLLLHIADAFAAPSWAAVGLASPGVGGALGCYGLGLAALRLRGAWRAAAAAAALAALLAPGALRALAARQRGDLEVVFLSVGQGDAAMLRLPDGAAVLVDAGGVGGGRYDPGARDVAPFLLDAGVRRVAAAFVSHPHSDHALGLPGVAAALPVERIFATGRAGEEAVQEALARLPAAVPLAAGDAFEQAGVRIEVLGPPAGAFALGDNDASLVLRVRHGAVALLFPGDIEAAGEAALLAAGADLSAQVVKVPHHGSRLSSSAALAAAVRPRWAVVSLATGNRFGFPHDEALGRWRAAGAEILRTDEGAIRFLSDGKTIRRADPGAALDAPSRWRGL
jgi:competence protein ComEC